jgi:hypothetical protein
MQGILFSQQVSQLSNDYSREIKLYAVDFFLTKIVEKRSSVMEDQYRSRTSFVEAEQSFNGLRSRGSRVGMQPPHNNTNVSLMQVL